MASGSRTGPLLASPAVALASLTLPDGTAVIAAAGDDGSLRWWDAPACRPLDGAAAAGAAPVLSLAPVLMPAPVLTPASAPGGSPAGWPGSGTAVQCSPPATLTGWSGCGIR